MHSVINPFPNRKNLVWSTFKGFAEDRNHWYPAFSPFPTVISKGFFLRTFKGLKGSGANIDYLMLVMFNVYIGINSFLHIYSFLHTEEKIFKKTLWEKVTLLKMSNVTFFHYVFYAICTLKSFNSHISVCLLQLL